MPGRADGPGARPAPGAAGWRGPGWRDSRWRSRCRSVVAGSGFALLCLAPLTTATPSAASGQTLTGRVVDPGSERAVPGVEVRVLGDAARVVARTLTHADGRFLFSDLAPGAYRVEVERFGYRTQRTEPLELAEDEVRHVDIQLEPEAIPLEELTVTSRIRRMRHKATYAGLYARHATSPPLGNNRVLLRTDPEFDNVMSVRDLLYNFRPGRCSVPWVFWHGFLAAGPSFRREYARNLLDVSVSNVEGIEYYRDFASMPLSFRGDFGFLKEPLPPSAIRRCGVIAIWPRRS